MLPLSFSAYFLEAWPLEPVPPIFSTELGTRKIHTMFRAEVTDVLRTIRWGSTSDPHDGAAMLLNHVSGDIIWFWWP